MSNHYYIGWDVGGWNCEKNSKSRDAIVILNSQAALIGKPFRGNLKHLINTSEDATDFVANLFKECKAPLLPDAQITMGVDTPLGYSAEFANLITGRPSVKKLSGHRDNPYLFRATERFLTSKGYRPLSAVQDMLGAQSTKGIHVLVKFGLKLLRTGVWSNGGLTIIETYPAANKSIEPPSSLSNQDVRDAYTCARVAEVFSNDPDRLYPPEDYDLEFAKEEGWIWVLKQNKND